MDNRTNSESAFVAYEYMSIYVKQEYEPVYTDCYANFGWQLIASREQLSLPQLSSYNPLSYSDVSLINLKFKRDRNLKGRARLNPLQKKCEGILAAIDSLERRKVTVPTTIALTFGVTGFLFLVGAVISFIAHIIPLFIVALIFGLAGCVLGYWYFRYTKESREAQDERKIDEQYEMLARICEEAKDIRDS
jgi:cbb3-type cytochrome oxidase subunit 3